MGSENVVISGADLRLMRESMGLTQPQVAEMMGMTMRGWQRYEHGHTTIPKTKLFMFNLAFKAHMQKFNANHAIETEKAE